MENKMYSPKKAAELLGVSVKTIQRWDVDGKIKAIRTPNDRRRIPESEIKRLLSKVVSNKKLMIYARVSSNEQKQKGDLDRQVEFIKSAFSDEEYSSIEVTTDVGSGLNDKRRGLIQMMEKAKKGEFTDLAIRYKDRLTRFGFHYLETYFSSFGIRIHIMDTIVKGGTIQEELVEDLIAIVTSFSGKLYGSRSGKNKLSEQDAKELLKDETNVSDIIEGSK